MFLLEVRMHIGAFLCISSPISWLIAHDPWLALAFLRSRTSRHVQRKYSGYIFDRFTYRAEQQNSNHETDKQVTDNLHRQNSNSKRIKDERHEETETKLFDVKAKKTRYSNNSGQTRKAKSHCSRLKLNLDGWRYVHHITLTHHRLMDVISPVPDPILI